MDPSDYNGPIADIVYYSFDGTLGDAIATQTLNGLIDAETGDLSFVYGELLPTEIGEAYMNEEWGNYEGTTFTHWDFFCNAILGVTETIDMIYMEVLFLMMCHGYSFGGPIGIPLNLRI